MPFVYEIYEIYCNIINVFTATFDQFNAAFFAIWQKKLINTCFLVKEDYIPSTLHIMCSEIIRGKCLKKSQKSR